MAETDSGQNEGTEQPSFRRLIETQELAKAAEKLNEGDTLATEEVCRITGRDPEKARGLCATVIKDFLKRNITLAFHPHRLGGLKRLTGPEALEYGSEGLGQGARKIVKSGKQIVTARDETLTDDERAKKIGAGMIVKMMTSVYQKRKAIGQYATDNPQPEVGDGMRRLFGAVKE